MVTHVDKRGYARVAPLGGVFPLYSVGARVRFADGRLGVLEVDRREDASKAPTLDQTLHRRGRDQPRRLPGESGRCGHLPSGTGKRSGERLIAKSLDDRIGCAILIETLRRLKQTPHEVYFVFSVQEETTSVGARTAAYSIDPDIAIAVDVTGTGDTPKALPMAVEMGKGPAIKVRDAGMIADPRVKNWMVQRAEAAQDSVSTGNLPARHHRCASGAGRARRRAQRRRVDSRALRPQPGGDDRSGRCGACGETAGGVAEEADRDE